MIFLVSIRVLIRFDLIRRPSLRIVAHTSLLNIARFSYRPATGLISCTKISLSPGFRHPHRADAVTLSRVAF